jgi:hypothetical protein
MRGILRWCLALSAGAIACALEAPLAPELMDAKAPNATQWDTMLVVPRDTSVLAGQVLQFCGFPVFRNGVVGLARVDAARCADAYARLPDSLTSVSRKQQAILDTLGPVTWSAVVWLPPIRLPGGES